MLRLIHITHTHLSHADLLQNWTAHSCERLAAQPELLPWRGMIFSQASPSEAVKRCSPNLHRAMPETQPYTLRRSWRFLLCFLVLVLLFLFFFDLKVISTALFQDTFQTRF